MDRNSDREESPVRGAEEPEAPAPHAGPNAAEYDSDSVFVSDPEDLGAAAPAPVDDPEPRRQRQPEVHHHQHRHCPTCSCPQFDREELATRREVRQLERSLSRVVSHQEELVSSLDRMVTSFAELAFAERDNAAPVGRDQRTRRDRRDTSGERARGQRRRSQWEPVQVISPIRYPQRGADRRRNNRGQYAPNRPSSPEQGWAARTPERPDRSLRQELDISPSSPSRIALNLRAQYPQFSAAQRRSTRNFLLEVLVHVREQHQTHSSDAGWAAYLTRLTLFSPYTSEEQVHLVWQLAFEQPPHAHFRSLWNRGIELLRAALPEDNYQGRADLIRF